MGVPPVSPDVPATESGTYRVLPGPPDSDGLVFLEQWAEDPVTVRTDGYEEPFVVVYLALDRESLLADTVRDEFDCPRG